MQTRPDQRRGTAFTSLRGKYPRFLAVTYRCSIARPDSEAADALLACCRKGGRAPRDQGTGAPVTRESIFMTTWSESELRKIAEADGVTVKIITRVNNA